MIVVCIYLWHYVIISVIITGPYCLPVCPRLFFVLTFSITIIFYRRYVPLIIIHEHLQVHLICIAWGTKDSHMNQYSKQNTSYHKHQHNDATLMCEFIVYVISTLAYTIFTYMHTMQITKCNYINKPNFQFIYYFFLRLSGCPVLIILGVTLNISSVHLINLTWFCTRQALLYMWLSMASLLLLINNI